MHLMAKELNLTPPQQEKLKDLLQLQHAQVLKVWNDSATAPAVRVSATQRINEETAEQIRGVLNDSQRGKYLKDHQHDTAVGAPGADVQKWLMSAQDR